MTTSETTQPSPGIPARPGASASPSAHWTHLGHALQGLLALYLVVCLAQAAFFAWQARTWSGWAERPSTVSLGTAETMDRWGVVAGISDLVFLGLIGPVFVTWLYLAHHSDRMYRPALRHRSGWAIGGWLVPILNLWRPLQMVNDVRRGAIGYDHADGARLTGWWWGLVLTTWLLGRLAGVYFPDATAGRRETFAALQDVSLALLAATLASAACCVLAIAVVRNVTRLVRTPATTH